MHIITPIPVIMPIGAEGQKLSSLSKVIQLSEEAKISKQACLILKAIYLLASLPQGHGQPNFYKTATVSFQHIC